MVKIEEAVNSKFRSEEHRTFVNLIYTANLVNIAHLRIFKSYGLTSQQFNVLRILRGRHPHAPSMTEMRDCMLDRESDTTRVVHGLVQRGLVERNVCKLDRRIIHVNITEAGLQLLAEMDPAVNELDKLLASMPSTQLQLLNDLLDQVRDAVADSPVVKEKAATCA